MINLDDLEAKRAKATKGKWLSSGPDVYSAEEIDLTLATHMFPPDAEYVAALINAAPELLAEVRELRAKVQRVEALRIRIELDTGGVSVRADEAVWAEVSPPAAS